MKTEHPIDEFIRKERSVLTSAHLTDRIMEQVELSLVENRNRATHFNLSSHTWWQTAAIAASFVLVIAAGISAGKLYSVADKTTTALNINDNVIENRNLLNSMAYE